MTEGKWLESFQAELKVRLDAIMENIDAVGRNFIIQHTAFVPDNDDTRMYINADGHDVYIPSQDWFPVFPGSGRDEMLIDADVQEAEETKVKLEFNKHADAIFTQYLDNRGKSVYTGDPQKWIMYAADMYEHTPKKYTGVAYTRISSVGWSVIRVKTKLPEQVT